MLERGGTLTAADMAAYEPIDREPVRAELAGREILTNPPPSAGGILIAFSLAVLDRARRTDGEAIVLAMEEAQSLRTEAFNRDLHGEGLIRVGSRRSAHRRGRRPRRRGPAGGQLGDRRARRSHGVDDPHLGP